MTSSYDASASAAGYFYQAKFALYILLKQGPGATVEIETLDDVSTSDERDKNGYFQLKHIVSNNSNITDSSANLWKTLRIWSEKLKIKEIDPNNTNLNFVTNGIAQKGSVAYNLKSPCQSEERDESSALEKLNQIASTSGSQTLKTSFESFNKLTLKEKKALLSCISVFDKSPNLIALEDEIQKLMSLTTRPQYLINVVQRIEGWWFNIVADLLINKGSISFEVLRDQINDIQDEYHMDNLPIQFRDLTPPQEDEIPDTDKAFIEQLKLISLHDERVKQAISDYYKAFHQRTKWVEDGNLNLDHLEIYESTLKDEWRRIYFETIEDIGDSVDESDNINAGRKIYNYLQKRTDLNIKEKCREAYVMRGTYHILANKLDVGWHPKFKEKLVNLYKGTLREVSESVER